MSIGDFPEILSRAMLVGTILVGRLGVSISAHSRIIPSKGKSKRGEGAVD